MNKARCFRAVLEAAGRGQFLNKLQRSDEPLRVILACDPYSVDEVLEQVEKMKGAQPPLIEWDATPWREGDNRREIEMPVIVPTRLTFAGEKELARLREEDPSARRRAWLIRCRDSVAMKVAGYIAVCAIGYCWGSCRVAG